MKTDTVPAWFGNKTIAGGALICLLAANLLAAENANVDSRVEALLARMTLDEKIGQMVQVDSGALKDKADVQKFFLGSVLSGGSSDPATGNSATDWLNFVEGFQNQALQTRLKIPLLYGIDAVHGHNNIEGAVIFPHNIGLGATRNPKLIEAAEHVTAAEMAGTGMRWAFAPCIAVARNERWGRTYESYSESPGLVSELGAAAVRGFQGARLSEPTAVLGLRQTLSRRRRHDQRHGPGQHDLRRGHAAENISSALSRGDPGGRRFHHGFVQQLEWRKNARQ